jgi:hypothetical protein
MSSGWFRVSQPVFMGIIPPSTSSIIRRPPAECRFGPARGVDEPPERRHLAMEVRIMARWEHLKLKSAISGARQWAMVGAAAAVVVGIVTGSVIGFAATPTTSTTAPPTTTTTLPP